MGRSEEEKGKKNEPVGTFGHKQTQINISIYTVSLARLIDPRVTELGN